MTTQATSASVALDGDAAAYPYASLDAATVPFDPAEMGLRMSGYSWAGASSLLPQETGRCVVRVLRDADASPCAAAVVPEAG